jgi:hypothetical protein
MTPSPANRQIIDKAYRKLMVLLSLPEATQIQILQRNPQLAMAIASMDLSRYIS